MPSTFRYVEPDDVFEIKDGPMRSALIYCANIVIKVNSITSHNFTKRELGTINRTWEIPKNDEYVFGGGYCFIDNQTLNPEKYKRSGMVRLHAKQGQVNPKYGSTQTHDGVVDVQHC